MLSCICLLKNVWKYFFFYRIWNQKEKTELSELNKLNAQKRPHRWAAVLINMFSWNCMVKQTHKHFFIDPTQNHKKLEKIQFEFFIKKNLWKIITLTILVLEYFAWRQIRENYKIYLPYKFHRRPQSAVWEPQLANNKLKTMFLWNMSKS